VAKRLNLDKGLDPNSPAYESLIRSMQSSIDVYMRGQDLFQITYKADTAKLACDVCRGIVDEYLTRIGKYYETRTKDNVTYFQTSLEEAQKQLKEAQDAVTKYQNENINEIPDVQASTLQQRANLQRDRQNNVNQIEGLQSQLIIARMKLNEMDKVTTASQTVSQQNPLLQQLQNRRRDLEMRLSNLRIKFQENHPDVKDAKLQLDKTDEEIAKAGSQQEETSVTRTANPQYQSLADQVMAFDLQISGLKSQVASQDKDIEKLNGYLQNIPERTLELSRFETQKQFAEERVRALMRQLEDARAAGKMEQTGQGARFVPIDPPREPSAPVSPNRVKIAALSVVMGAAAAGAMILLLTMLDSAVRSVEEARQLLQMPVLGVVQRITTTAESAHHKRRRNRRVVGVGVLLFLIALAATASFLLWGDQLRQGVESVRAMLGNR
jgi:polysaccharide biosynthesis transport protein